MKTVEETPTEPLDYALLSVTYGSLLATAALAARSRAQAEPIETLELLPIAAATFALSRTMVDEKAVTWLRRPFVAEPAGQEARPRGRRMRYVVGELLTCTRCLGTWSALGIVALRTARPPAGRLVTNVLAARAANDFLQAGFSRLCASTNQVEQETELTAHRAAA